MTDRPWMAALEMRFAVLRIAHWILQNPGATDALRFASDGAAQLLPGSETYAWTRETAMATCLAAQSIPDSATFTVDQLPSPVCWWWFEQPLPIALPDADTPERMGREIGALVIGPIDDGRIALIVHRFAKLDDRPEVLMPTSVYAINPGTRLSNIRQDISTQETADQRFRMKRIYEVVRFVIAACAWLQQRIVSVSLGHVERHRRKQLAREHNTPLPSDVKIIQLRRYESESHSHQTDGETVDWSCRWIVSGHWRNQPYKDEHKLIYISPYVKGPDDKPLRVPSHTVYQVNR